MESLKENYDHLVNLHCDSRGTKIFWDPWESVILLKDRRIESVGT